MGTSMELDEIRERIQMRELMEERARQSYAPSTHPCEGMSLQGGPELRELSHGESPEEGFRAEIHHSQA